MSNGRSNEVGFRGFQWLSWLPSFVHAIRTSPVVGEQHIAGSYCPRAEGAHTDSQLVSIRGAPYIGTVLQLIH